MADESRIFWRHKPDPGSEVDNTKTILGPPVDSTPLSSHLSLEEQFKHHYPTIRDWLVRHAERAGLILFALTDEVVHGAALLATKPDRINSSIVGRHSKADMRLQGDSTLSLRHVAVLLFPDDGKSENSCRYRLVDLRSASGFVDERGKRLRAIEADGPAFVRVGSYSLVVLPVDGDGGDWPEDADDAWSRIPDRLYLDEVETEEKSIQWDVDSDKAWEVEALPALSRPPTLVHNIAGPEMAVHELLDDSETPLGELVINSSRGEAKIVVGEKAAHSGILLGRSRRCDAGRVLSDRSISRVHLLIIRIAGVLYAVDTASSNGVFDADARERASHLTSGVSLAMSDVAVIEWRSTEA